MKAMVNKENMRLVVAALRSGRYPQGTGMLKQVTLDGTVLGYCCMGVMCEVAMEHGVDIETQLVSVNDSTKKVSFAGSTAFLRDNVIGWLGVGDNGELDRDLVIGKDGNEEISAAFANDGLRWDFERIAASMESYYKLLEDDDVETVAPASQD